MDDSEEQPPAQIAYIPTALGQAIEAAARVAAEDDPTLTPALARLRVYKDALTWLQGNKALGWSGELLLHGRRIRGDGTEPIASWAEMANAARLGSGQSAYSFWTQKRGERLAKMAEHTKRRMAPVSKPAMPGVGVVEAARRLGVTTGTIYARVKRNELAHEYVGDSLRITASLEGPEPKK
ncbi:UNVERIFIED_ORG: excisionase family DNA binding protein [Arthrobacter sp. UYEF2]